MASPAGAGAAPLWTRLAPAIFLLLWSGGFAFLPLGLAHAGPMTFLALRYALVLVVLLPLVVALRPAWPRRPAAWAHLAAIGVLIQAGYFGLAYLSVWAGLSAAGLALIVSLQPILVALLAPGLLGERVHRLRWIGLALGLAGAVIVILARAAVEAVPTGGLLLAIAALCAMVAATLYEKRFGAGGHPVAGNTIQYTVGFVCILPLALAIEGFAFTWHRDLILATLYLGLGNSLVSITLLLAMIRRGEASRVSALFFLVPPTAALLAWLMVGDALPPLAWLGMALAASGVALVSRVPPPRQTT